MLDIRVLLVELGPRSSWRWGLVGLVLLIARAGMFLFITSILSSGSGSA